ncbi:MAG: hypothetical protein RDV48_31415 [Candidatus Eremiobacteraeota bacterium]|nr:hypothetical protein [Candidatus Eremiobacteraeota bacterium]
MADEITRVETSSSPVRPSYQQASEKKEKKEEQPEKPAAKKESCCSDCSCMSRESKEKKEQAAQEKERGSSDDFRKSLWESLKNEKGSPVERQAARETEESAPETRGTLQPAASQDLSTAAGDLRGQVAQFETMKPQSPLLPQGADQAASQAQEAIKGAGEDQGAPQGANGMPDASKTPPVNPMQMQMQMMQTMMQTMTQMMQMMTQMMQTMMKNQNGQNNNKAADNNNNGGTGGNNNGIDNSGTNGANGTNPKKWGNLISSWRQGSEGNCVSVATIKAAMHKWGNQVFNKAQKNADGSYDLTLKDGKNVKVSADELKTATRMSSFRGSGEELDYANLCYAAMAKRALENRHEGASSFARACHSLNNGEQIEYPIKLLGIQDHTKKISTRDIPNHEIAITWNSGHCLYATNGKVDGYGRETAPSRWGLHGAYALI